MRCLHRMPGETMMGLMSGVLRMHGHAQGLRATGHMVPSEPSRTRRWVWSHRKRAVVLVLRSHDDAKAFLRRGWT
jgi:hypothetical protein